MDLIQPLKAVVPAEWKAGLRQAQRRWRLNRALQALETEARRGAVKRSTFEAPVFGWGNAGWSVQHEYMQALVELASNTQGPILECGSGLSTIMLSKLLGEEALRIWSLEHTPAWADHLDCELERFSLSGPNIIRRGISDRGDYDWYDIAQVDLPRDISLVLWDGPPNSTRGQRYGRLPEMAPHLAKGCTILVDDMERPEERAMVSRWQEEFGGTVEVTGTDKPFAVYRI